MKTPFSRPTAIFGRRAAIIAAPVSALLIALVALVWVGWSRAGRESTDSAFIDGHRATVATQASGRVVAILVDDNERVTAGQVLLRIDPSDYAVKLQQAEAARAQAAGALGQARAKRIVVQAMARQAQAQANVAQANARKSADDVRRFRGLSADAMPRIALEAAVSQGAATAAQFDAAQQAAQAAAAEVELARTSITTAEANLRAADAQVALAKLALSYCELRAPIAGRVTRKGVELGNYVQTGQPVLNLVGDDRFVTANFKETQLTHLEPGQPAIVTVDTYPGLVLHGRVDSEMAGTGSAFALLPAENASGTFVKTVQRVPVKIVFDPSERDRLPGLALGLSVIATVDVQSAGPARPHAATATP